MEKVSEGEFFVTLRERHEKGKANYKLIKLLAKEFKVFASAVKIKNLKSRIKVVEIKEENK